MFAGLATVGYAVILQPDDLLVTAGGSVWGIGALTGNRAFVTSGPASVGTGPEFDNPGGIAVDNLGNILVTAGCSVTPKKG